MGATSNAYSRRKQEGYFSKYFKGVGIDIGAGRDPVTPDCLVYDKIFGNEAQTVPDLPYEHFDWVFSSHCLEHVENPRTAVELWWDLVKPEGYLIISVPHYILYEHRQFPSLFNHDHKHTFSMFGRKWCHARPNHHVLSDLFSDLDNCQILSYRLCDNRYNYGTEQAYDRTYGEAAEAEIEIICRKKPNYWIEEP